MASVKNKNKKKRPNSGGKSRTLVLLFSLIILVAGLGLALWSFKQGHFDQITGGSRLKNTPGGIQSVPGVTSASEEYVKIQRTENAERAAAAEKNKTAAVPTITRTGYVGSIDSLTQPALPTVNHAGCSKEELERARQAGVKAEELRCKGCSAKELRAAGYSAAELKNAGFLASDLKDAGYSVEEMRAAGYTARELKDAGFSAVELKAAGYSAADLKDAGYSAKELIDSGYSVADLKAAGFTASDLKAAGVSASALRTVGFSAAELKDSGFSTAELNAAGFSPSELLAAGFSQSDLEKTGIRAEQVKAAASTVGSESNMPKNCSVAELTKAKKQGIKAADLKKRLSCPVVALKAAGYTATELKAAGYTAGELKAGGFNAQELKAAGFTAKELKAAGFNARQLRDAGFTAVELKNAGFTPNELCDAGFTATELLGLGFSATELRGAACISLENLKTAGVDPAALKKIGLTDGELIRAGFAADQVNPPPSPVIPPAAPAVPENNALASSLIPEVPGSENKTEQLMERMRKQQAAQLSEQQRQELLQQIQAGMSTQASDLFASWNVPPAQQRVVGEEDKTGPAAVAAAGGAGGGTGADKNQAVNGQLIKAGTIMFATLDTGINSDEESPILATIVQGKLKGAKLLGQFKRTDKKVVLSFTTMSVPSLPNSISVNTVAIDPDTARTAVASDVDSHYLLRYGTLFASSFLSGLGQAVTESGATVVDTGLGQTVITNPSTTTSEKGLIALGEVGTQFGKQLSNVFNTPPTVKVNSGAGLGILFMADAAIPNGN